MRGPPRLDMCTPWLCVPRGGDQVSWATRVLPGPQWDRELASAWGAAPRALGASTGVHQANVPGGGGGPGNSCRLASRSVAGLVWAASGRRIRRDGGPRVGCSSGTLREPGRPRAQARSGPAALQGRRACPGCPLLGQAAWGGRRVLGPLRASPRQLWWPPAGGPGVCGRRAPRLRMIVRKGGDAIHSQPPRTRRPDAQGDSRAAEVPESTVGVGTGVGWGGGPSCGGSGRNGCGKVSWRWRSGWPVGCTVFLGPAGFTFPGGGAWHWGSCLLPTGPPDAGWPCTPGHPCHTLPRTHAAPHAGPMESVSISPWEVGWVTGTPR